MLGAFYAGVFYVGECKTQVDFKQYLWPKLIRQPRCYSHYLCNAHQLAQVKVNLWWSKTWHKDSVLGVIFTPLVHTHNA